MRVSGSASLNYAALFQYTYALDIAFLLLIAQSTHTLQLKKVIKENDHKVMR